MKPARQQWLTIPTHLPSGRPTLIRDAVIDGPALARRRTAGVLRQHYRASAHWPAFAEALDLILDAFDTSRTATVAETSTRVLLDLLGWKGQVLTSSRLPARSGRSVRLADLAAATGARGYLCGTGGMTYLDQNPFAAQNIAVVPFQPPTTGIWFLGRRLSALWALAALGPPTPWPLASESSPPTTPGCGPLSDPTAPSPRRREAPIPIREVRCPHQPAWRGHLTGFSGVDRVLRAPLRWVRREGAAWRTQTRCC